MAKETIFNVLWPIIKWHGWEQIAEIGVDEAYTSRLIAGRCDSIKRYLLIDPWKEYQGEGAGSLARVNQYAWDQKYRNVCKMAGTYDCFKVIRAESVEISRAILDQSLDMVFIDACHDYENAKADIAAWIPKIKIGGALMGHDYSKHFPGVKKAIDELIPERIIIFGSIWGIQITEDIWNQFMIKSYN